MAYMTPGGALVTDPAAPTSLSLGGGLEQILAAMAASPPPTDSYSSLRTAPAPAPTISPGGTPVSSPTAPAQLSLPGGSTSNFTDIVSALVNQAAARNAGPTTSISPGGVVSSSPTAPSRMAIGSATDPALAPQLEQTIRNMQLVTLLRNAGLGQFTPQPFGTASTGTEAGTGPSARGGDTTSIGSGAPNTGGVGMAASDAVAGGFGALGGFSSSNPGISLGGNIGVESGFNASPNSQGIAISPSSDLGQSMAEAIDSSSAVTGALSGVNSVNVGTTPSGEQVSVNPSTGVVSVGGEAVGVVGGGGGGVSGGGGGDSMGGIGLGGVADGSSNAGIGGPGGTGAVGGAGDAGQGTGGPGEGDQYGDQYIVPGRGPPDSVNARLRVSPGELITVTPPGRGFGLRGGGGGDPRTGVGELSAILRHMMMPPGGLPRGGGMPGVRGSGAVLDPRRIQMEPVIDRILALMNYSPNPEQGGGPAGGPEGGDSGGVAY